MEVPRGLEVIPLSPKSDNNYNSKDSNKKVIWKAFQNFYKNKIINNFYNL